MRYIDGKQAKVGDIVEVLDNKTMEADRHTRGLVINLEKDDDFVCVEWIDDTIQDWGWYDASHFGLISRRKKGLKDRRSVKVRK